MPKFTHVKKYESYSKTLYQQVGENDKNVSPKSAEEVPTSNTDNRLNRRLRNSNSRQAVSAQHIEELDSIAKSKNGLKTSTELMKYIRKLWNDNIKQLVVSKNWIADHISNERSKYKRELGGSSVYYQSKYNAGKIAVSITKYDLPNSKTSSPKYLQYITNLKNKIKSLFKRKGNSVTEATNQYVPLEYATTTDSYDEFSDYILNVDLQLVLAHLDRLKNDRSTGLPPKPIFIYGAPGIGKTSIVNSFAKMYGLTVLRMDLSTRDATDLLGVQYPSEHNKNRAELLIPRIWPDPEKEEKGPGGILFFDELNRADGLMVNATMAFLDDRGFSGVYKLPDNWIIVSAGNRTVDSELVNEMDSALAGRFSAIMNYRVTFDEWRNWAEKNDAVDPKILEFISIDPDNRFYTLHSGAEGYPYGSPRTWESASNTYRYKMRKIENAEPDDPIYGNVKGNKAALEKHILDAFATVVGPSLGREITKFLMTDIDWTADDAKIIFTDPENAPKPKPSADGYYNPEDMKLLAKALNRAAYEYSAEHKEELPEEYIRNVIRYVDEFLKEGETHDDFIKDTIKSSLEGMLGRKPKMLEIKKSRMAKIYADWLKNKEDSMLSGEDQSSQGDDDMNFIQQEFNNVAENKSNNLSHLNNFDNF